VLHDVIGLSDLRLKFAKQFADLRAATIAATTAYVDDVRAGAWPDDDHSSRLVLIVREIAADDVERSLLAFQDLASGSIGASNV